MKCVMYWYFFSKSIELMDTVLMVVRKKNNQITFLHVFHHASMFNIWWWVMTFIPAGSSKFGIISSLYVVMSLEHNTENKNFCDNLFCPFIEKLILAPAQWVKANKLVPLFSVEPLSLNYVEKNERQFCVRVWKFAFSRCERTPRNLIPTL